LRPARTERKAKWTTPTTRDDIYSSDVYSGDVYSGDVYSGDVYSGDVYSGDVYSGDVYSGDLGAGQSVVSHDRSSSVVARANACSQALVSQ
jgi:hypothetical protein